jgi:hypothetical protein
MIQVPEKCLPILRVLYMMLTMSTYAWEQARYSSKEYKVVPGIHVRVTLCQHRNNDNIMQRSRQSCFNRGTVVPGYDHRNIVISLNDDVGDNL